LPYINEGYDVIGTRCIYLSYDMNRNGIVPGIPAGDISMLNFLEQNPLINSSAVIKKDLAYWDGYFNGVEDYCLWLELRD
jgi:hypothetical protein